MIGPTLIPASVIAPVFHAIRVVGPLIARGWMSREEALPPLLERAAVLAPGAPPTALQWRVRDALEAATAAFARDHALACRDVQAALRPLLLRRAPSTELLAAARHASAAHRAPLMAYELDDLVDAAIAGELQWKRREMLAIRRDAARERREADRAR